MLAFDDFKPGTGSRRKTEKPKVVELELDSHARAIKAGIRADNTAALLLPPNCKIGTTADVWRV